MDNFLTIAPLVITLIGLIYFAQKKMKKLGVVYVIVYYVKWFFGIIVTMSAFYAIMLSSNALTELGYPAVFSLIIGVVVWFPPMHYLTKFFTHLEKKFKKTTQE